MAFPCYDVNSICYLVLEEFPCLCDCVWPLLPQLHGNLKISLEVCKYYIHRDGLCSRIHCCGSSQLYSLRLISKSGQKFPSQGDVRRFFQMTSPVSMLKFSLWKWQQSLQSTCDWEYFSSTPLASTLPWVPGLFLFFFNDCSPHMLLPFLRDRYLDICNVASLNLDMMALTCASNLQESQGLEYFCKSCCAVNRPQSRMQLYW